MAKKKAIKSKGRLAVVLSGLEGFEKPKVRLEQYQTPGEIAADWMWRAFLNGDVRGKVMVDAACGPGILGLGGLLLDAKKVFFVDKDSEVLKVAKKNYKKLKSEHEGLGEGVFVEKDIRDFNEKTEVWVQNPPFGTKKKHVDKIFLEKAFLSSKIVYSMHKISTKRFVEAVAKDYGFGITHLWEYDFKIKAAFKFHRLRSYEVKVGLWRLVKDDGLARGKD